MKTSDESPLSQRPNAKSCHFGRFHAGKATDRVRVTWPVAERPSSHVHAHTHTYVPVTKSERDRQTEKDAGKRRSDRSPWGKLKATPWKTHQRACFTYHRHVRRFILPVETLLGNADSLSQRMAHLCATGVYWHQPTHTHIHTHGTAAQVTNNTVITRETVDTFAVNLIKWKTLCGVNCHLVSWTTTDQVKTPWKNMVNVGWLLGCRARMSTITNVGKNNGD